MDTRAATTDDVRVTWSGEDKMADITCRLEPRELWDKFHALGTEMIITKSGRLVAADSFIRRHRERC